jgi:hypothetical protein
MMTNKLILGGALLAMGLFFSAHAQHPQIALHPTPTDLATTLNAIDISYSTINEAISTLPQEPKDFATVAGFCEQLVAMRDIARKWAAVITVSSGKEMPPASTLFLLFTGAQGVQSFVSEQTKDERSSHLTNAQVLAATKAIRAATDLIYLTQTLEYATSDRIDQEEAVIKPQSAGRKR